METNANIIRHNEHERALGHKGNKRKKPLKKPERLWKVETRKRGEKHCGIDWWIYREKVRSNCPIYNIITNELKISLPLLYPYYESIQKANPGRVIGLLKTMHRATIRQLQYAS